jgi:hypothetical protein
MGKRAAFNWLFLFQTLLKLFHAFPLLHAQGALYDDGRALRLGASAL